ncbi:MAG: endolytic transglycosylase MltG, partial [bacterium]
MQYLYKYIPTIKDFLKAHKRYVWVIGICVAIIIFLSFLISGPSNKKEKINVNISSGLSLMQVSLLLKENHIIRSEDIFRAVVILSGGESSIKAGPYLFDGTENVFKIAIKIINADYGVPVKKITVIEGMRGRDMLNFFGNEFANMNKAELEKEILSREGYLFPDTYFFPLSASSGDIIKMMSDNFLRHISGINLSDSKTSKDLNEIITMASIIEGEAVKDEDRKIISDILWRRIEIGMMLQVDTAFM